MEKELAFQEAPRREENNLLVKLKLQSSMVALKTDFDFETSSFSRLIDQ